MKKFQPHIIFCLLVGFVFCSAIQGGVAWSDDGDSGATAMEAELLTRINWARNSPLEAAVSLGKDADELLAALPHMADVLTNGVGALTENTLLKESATAHTQDMLDRDYYGKLSPEGEGPADRIEAAGYLAQTAAGVFGGVAFRNFMEPSAAVDIIFKNLFLDELKADTASPSILLNPDYKEIGIGIRSGTLTIGGTLYNVYLATCDVAAPQGNFNTVKMALQLMQLINQARAFPLDVAEALGYERGEVLEKFPESAAYLYTGMPPLAADRALMASAADHTADMVQRDYFSGTSPEGLSAEDRIAAAGYTALYAGELIFQYTADADTSPDEMVAAIFNMLFAAEIDPAATGDQRFRLMLERSLEDVGAAMACTLETVDGQEKVRCIGTVAAGLKLEWENPKIAGLVFADRNFDGLYTPGEELVGAQLAVLGNGILETDDAGQFQLPKEPGIYQISLFAADQSEALQKEVDLDYDNKGIYFILDEDAALAQ